MAKAPRLRRSKRQLSDTDIFINCPFDQEYEPLRNAIIFTIVRSGFRARCALETDNGAENRFSKICNIIDDCRLGIHDISRTELGPKTQLPRFNMPLELGLFLGAQRYGSERHRQKSCLIFDRDQFRYREFISDIAGQDVSAHNNDPENVIRQLTKWLRQQPGGTRPGGGSALIDEYRQFTLVMPELCRIQKLELHELQFADVADMATTFSAQIAGGEEAGSG